MLNTSTVFQYLTMISVSYVGLPSNDTRGWYYPSHGYETDEDEVDVRFSTAAGNWGRKAARDARWVRHGKMAAWGPSMEEWEVCRDGMNNSVEV
jgi:hypothetical protein